jgi:hypothetical protein
MKMARMATIQIKSCHTQCQAGWPLKSARAELTAMDTGWWLAHAWSHPGMVLTGTKAELANTSGNMGTNPAS